MSMILFNGQLLPDEQMNSVLKKLPDFCIQTIEEREIKASRIIRACGILSERIQKGDYNEFLHPLIEQGVFTRRQLEESVLLFTHENLEYKYQIELGSLIQSMEALHPPGQKHIIRRQYRPLGILFHIAAGNAEGLPFYSVIEGLLAGNINILKLPSADDGLSVFLLRELTKLYPDIAPYIAVFDIPSTNPGLLKKLGHMADAIVVWGGDDAVQAVRNLADTQTQIISWGHKLSFAYAAMDAPESEFRKLARHICETSQLLCSSCQGIFLDTKDLSAVKAVGTRFLSYLEEESAQFPKPHLGIRGKISISLYNEELEAAVSHRKVLRGNGVSVILSDDHRLELSYMHRNCWVKPLPRRDIIRALKPYRGHLQTAALLCSVKDMPYLKQLLLKSGVVRITDAERMSAMVSGGTHDGEYPLRRYSRIVEIYE